MAATAEKTDWRTIVHFDRQIVSSAKPFLLAWVLAVAIGAPLTVVPPLLVGRLIDRVLVSGDLADVYLMAALIAATTLLAPLVKAWASYCLSRAAIRGVADLRADLFEQIQRTDLRSLYGVGVDGLFQRVTHGLTQIRSGIGTFWGEMTFGVVSVAACAAVMAHIDPVLLILCAALYVPYLVAKRLVFRGEGTTSANWNSQIEAYSGVMGVVREAIEGIRLVKTCDAADVELRRLEEAQRGYLTEFLRYLRIVCRTMFLNIVMFLLPEALTYLYLGRRIYAGDASIGSLFVVVGLFPQLRHFVLNFSRLAFHRDGHGVHIQRIEALRRLPTDAYERAPAHVPQGDAGGRRVRGRITFRDVAFSFIADRPVLENVSFTIEPGEKVGIVGVSGVGKSTLANLIVGLEKPDSGSILIDDVPLEGWSMDALRRSVAYVSQELYLLNGTVRQNLQYGMQAASDEALWRALAAADLHGLVRGYPRGLETIVGEGGLLLSGGQRQRLSIARAYLRDPQIVILDETTAALDLDSEARVYEAQSRLLGHCTTLVITHRTGVLASLDRIILLEEGRVRETGTHGQLLARGQRYAALFAGEWE